MEEYVTNVFALIGLCLLCYVVGRFMFWPFVTWISEGLNGGVDEGEAYEAELQATLEGLQRQLDDQEIRTDGVETQGNENTNSLKGLNHRVVETEKTFLYFEKKFSEIYANLKANNDILSSHFKRISSIEFETAKLQESFDLHRESFERLLEVLGGTAKKKIITKGKSS